LDFELGFSVPDRGDYVPLLFITDDACVLAPVFVCSLLIFRKNLRVFTKFDMNLIL